MISDYEAFKNTIESFNAGTIYSDKKEVRKILKSKDAYKYTTKLLLLNYRIEFSEKQNNLFNKYNEENEEFKKEFDKLETKIRACGEILEILEENE